MEIPYYEGFNPVEHFYITGKWFLTKEQCRLLKEPVADDEEPVLVRRRYRVEESWEKKQPYIFLYDRSDSNVYDYWEYSEHKTWWTNVELDFHGIPAREVPMIGIVKQTSWWRVYEVKDHPKYVQYIKELSSKHEELREKVKKMEQKEKRAAYFKKKNWEKKRREKDAK